MSVKFFLKKARKFFLDTLFPAQCLFCGKNEVWICEICFCKIKLNEEQRCPKCKKITPNGHVCFGCKNKNDLDGIMVCSHYNDHTVSHIIHFCKYRFVRFLGVILGKIMVKHILNQEIPLPDIIIPIPLHPRRMRWRGFNQAEIIANHIAGNIAPNLIIPLRNNILVRKRFTYPQTKIKDIASREKNMHEAFSVNQEFEKEITDKNIWLIDDVVTTGSTLLSAGKVLKKAGAKEVFGIVAAR